MKLAKKNIEKNESKVQELKKVVSENMSMPDSEMVVNAKLGIDKIEVENIYIKGNYEHYRNLICQYAEYWSKDKQEEMRRLELYNI